MWYHFVPAVLEAQADVWTEYTSMKTEQQAHKVKSQK